MERWWTNPDLLRAEHDKHGTLERASAAHGGHPSARTLRDWWHRHGFEAHAPGPKIGTFAPQLKAESVKWGFGEAPLVKWAGTDTDEIGVSLSDLHVPYHNEKAVSSAVNLIRALKPHRVILNGDISDFFQLSRFNTGLHRIDELQNEIDAGNEIRRRIRGAAPDATFDETEGNHDNRILSYVKNNARALVSLRALEPANLFLYDELEIRWHPGAGFRIRPDFMVKHGTLVRAEAGASAKAEHLLSGISGFSGHTHKLATWRRSGYVQRQWTEQGCLCRTDPDYVTGRPNWTQGCVVYEISRRTGSFVVHEVPFVDGHLRFGGRTF